MNCTLCNKPITSKVTGEFCASCYFKNKNASKSNNAIEIPAIVIPPENTELRPKADSASIPEEIPIEETEPEIKHNPGKIPNTSIEVSKKYCQSCIERGYGLKEASREWNKGYFICDDCFNPLVNNLLVQNNQEEIERVKPEVLQDLTSPALQNFYQLLNIPPELQFSNSDDVINNRNDIQNHHALALVNMSDEQVIQQLEFYHVILFNIRYRTDFNKDRINRIKAQVREEKNLLGFEKSKKEVSKKTGKTKLSDEEKLAVRLFPDLSTEKALETMRAMAKAAKEKEFEKLTGGK